MTIRVAIRHLTTYSFDRAVSLSPHVFRLRPAVHSRTPIKAYSLRIEPKDHLLTGNRILSATFSRGWYSLKNAANSALKLK